MLLLKVNYLLSKDELKGIGFYPLTSAGAIGSNKAYKRQMADNAEADNGQ